MKEGNIRDLAAADLSDADIIKAMKTVQGYLDITPGDFKELYRLAYAEALERIRTSVKAVDVMTQKVHTVGPDQPLQEVAALMARYGIAGMPVTTPDRLVAGIISEKDFLSHMGSKGNNSFMAVVAQCLGEKRCAAMGVRGRTAQDIMTTPAICVEEMTPLAEITELLRRRHINRVPVVNPAKQLVGIISRANIIRASF